MKTSSLPNLYRETTSFPNFFSLIEQLDHHHDTTLNNRPKINHSDDTEDSETSPFKDILSPFVSFDEVGSLAAPGSVGLFRHESDQTLPNTSSVGSNQFSGNGSATSCSVGPNPTQLWWDQCQHPDFPEDEFRCAFKMSKSTFHFICTQLHSHIATMNSIFELAIPSTPEFKQRVAVCIWHLATGEPLHFVSSRFGLGISTCSNIVLEVCRLIYFLKVKYLDWPDEVKMKGVKREFELVSGIPNVGGSMFTAHFPIKVPKLYFDAYFNKRHTERNQKTTFTVTIQGVVDSKGIFTDICVGWPGSMTDDTILEKSELLRRELLKDAWIVGSSGYPLMDSVLVAYAQQNMGSQRVFNEEVGKVQRVAKEAFSRLKARWRCLQNITEVKLQELPLVLGACCVLHNICEMRNEAMDPADTSFDLFDDEIVPENGVRSVAAMQARDQIAQHLLNRNFVLTRARATEEQKDKMLEFADWLGRRIQKLDEAAVERFSGEIGVSRQVLGVWMHDNKHTLG